MYNEKIQAEITINAPKHKVFNFLINPENIPLVMPGLIENYNVSEFPIQVGTRFNFRYQAFGLVQEGETIVDGLTPDYLYSFSTTGALESKWVQTISGDDTSANFMVEVEYKTPESWIEKLKLEIIKKINQGDIEKYIQNLKITLEE